MWLDSSIWPSGDYRSLVDVTARLVNDPGVYPGTPGHMAAFAPDGSRLAVQIGDKITALVAEVRACFQHHPDAEVYLSQPNLGIVLAARVLAEFDDDPEWYRDTRSRKNYAGNNPITRQSGKKATVLGPLRPQRPAGRRFAPAGLLRATRLSGRLRLLRRAALPRQDP